VTYLALRQVGGWEQLFSSIPSEHLTLHLMWEHPLRYFPFLLCLAPLDPTLIQRLLMGKGVKQLRSSFCISAFMAPLVFICAAIVGFCALVINPNIPDQTAMPHLIQTLLPVGLKGLMVAGLLAAIMSTADSNLNISSIIAVGDLVRACRGRMPERQMIRYSQYVTLIFGVLSLFISLRFDSIIDILLYFNGFWAGTVSTPLVACLLGYKSSRYAFTWAAVTGGLVVVGWILFDLEQRWGIYGLFPGVIVNSAMFFGMNAYSKWRGISAKEQKQDALLLQQHEEMMAAYEEAGLATTNDDFES
jgi:SSS family solute:Na+ symporter